jgi:hypothetical protein
MMSGLPALLLSEEHYIHYLEAVFEDQLPQHIPACRDGFYDEIFIHWNHDII